MVTELSLYGEEQEHLDVTASIAPWTLPVSFCDRRLHLETRPRSHSLGRKWFWNEKLDFNR